jgi:predicted signal transduction protein with EAL and GGDEF domain
MSEEGVFSSPRPGLRAGTPRRKPDVMLDPLIQAALNTASCGMIVLDNNKQVQLITQRAADFLGLRDGTRGGGAMFMHLAAQSHVLDDACLHMLSVVFSAADLPDRRDMLLSVPKPDGGVRVLNLGLRRAAAQGWLVSLEDVSHSRATNDFLLEQAEADPVTGLANKRHFVRVLRARLEANLTGSSETTLVLLRLSLKRPGPASLSLLPLAARRIQACLRDEDLAARFMGDEFAILVNQCGDRDVVGQLSERFVNILSRPFMIEGQSIRIGAHIGVACAPDDGDVAEALLANAELALAASRAEHRGGWRFFEPRQSEQARCRRALEKGLRHAVTGQEFVLHYQPQIDLRSGRVRVFEALVRWHSAERGLVPPDEFIPLAEEMGLISDIGIWVLNTACREAAHWPGDIAVAVNASPLQIEAGDFADAVAQALESSGLPAHRLEIEITENLLLAARPAVTETLARLRDMGVHLVMDDFGTGYASLSQLARFRFNKIKIDRSLISAPDTVAEHSAIVRAIAALGVSLCVPTTAEGVETTAQLARITEDGCTLVQGYYFSKPVPADAIAGLVEQLEMSTPLQNA